MDLPGVGPVIGWVVETLTEGILLGAEVILVWLVKGETK